MIHSLGSKNNNYIVYYIVYDPLFEIYIFIFHFLPSFVHLYPLAKPLAPVLSCKGSFRLLLVAVLVHAQAVVIAH